MHKETRNSVAAVVVTHNRLDKLRLTLGKTFAQPFKKIVIVNNASNDGTYDYLRSLVDPRLQIFHEENNIGGAGGFARGFAAVISDPCIDWLVCFDDDAYPMPDALESFLALELPNDVGGVAAAVYYPDGRICPMNRPGMDIFSSPLRLMRAALRRTSSIGIEYEAYSQEEKKEICFSSFVGLFVRCSLIRDAFGLPRKEFFVYRDDSIYTLDITKSGYKLLFVPQIRFVHDCATPSSGRRIYSPAWKIYYIIRNDIPFFRRFAGKYFFIIFPLLLLKYLLPMRCYDKPMAYLRLALISILDGLTGNYSRRHVDIVTLCNNLAFSR